MASRCKRPTGSRHSPLHVGMSLISCEGLHNETSHAIAVLTKTCIWEVEQQAGSWLSYFQASKKFCTHTHTYSNPLQTAKCCLSIHFHPAELIKQPPVIHCIYNCISRLVGNSHVYDICRLYTKYVSHPAIESCEEKTPRSPPVNKDRRPESWWWFVSFWMTMKKIMKVFS